MAARLVEWGLVMRLNLAGWKWIPVDGYGRMSLGIGQALAQAGHKVYPFDMSEVIEKPAWFQQAVGLDFSHVTVQLMPPHNMEHLPGRSISWSMHESGSIPEGWGNHVNEKTQLMLVPSPWLIDVFREGGVKIPIEVVPGGIAPDECPIMGQRTNRPYTFMGLADRGFRKGWDIVHTAFYKAFDATNKDVRLILKCRPGSLPAFMDFSYSPDDRFTIWRADVTKVADVFAQADACLNPNRCEGYGMWPREAAACGIPTVVTRWSGTADDCDSWAVPLETFTLAESHMEGCGGIWAEPDADELIWRMQDMVSHQDEYKAEALKAAQWMRQNQTYGHAAEKLVGVIARHLGGPRELQAKGIEPVAVDNRAEAAKWGPVLQVVKSGNGHGPTVVVVP